MLPPSLVELPLHNSSEKAVESAKSKLLPIKHEEAQDTSSSPPDEQVAKLRVSKMLQDNAKPDSEQTASAKNVPFRMSASVFRLLCAVAGTHPRDKDSQRKRGRDFMPACSHCDSGARAV